MVCDHLASTLFDRHALLNASLDTNSIVVYNSINLWQKVHWLISKAQVEVCQHILNLNFY